MNIFLFASSMTAGRHRSVQIYRSNYSDSIPLGILINPYPVESVLGKTS